MKRTVCALAVLALFFWGGCARQEPEDAAKAIVDRQIATQHEGFILDASDLEYEVVEEGEDFARVVVSGEIDVKGEIALVKEGGKWVLGTRPPAPAATKAPAPQPAPAAGAH